MGGYLGPLFVSSLHLLIHGHKESGGQLIERGSLVAVGGGGYLLSGGLPLLQGGGVPMFLEISVHGTKELMVPLRLEIGSPGVFSQIDDISPPACNRVSPVWVRIYYTRIFRLKK